LGIALVQRTGLLEYLMDDWDDAEQKSTVRIKRRGMPAKVFTFSMKDAQRANLAGKDTYRQYPQRMCGWRAKTFAIRSEFADALKGLLIAEEAMDLPPESEPIELPPISMPREIGQPAPELPAARELEPEQADARDPMPADPADARDPVCVFVAEVKEKSYADPKGKAKPYYVVEFSDGVKASTFSESLFDLAHQAGADRKPVAYTTKPGKKEGSLNLATLVLAEPAADAGQPEGGSDGTGG
jgi:hypothetical protein